MALRQCIECGYSVSEFAAEVCPNCKGEFRGRPCGVCGNTIAMSASVFNYGFSTVRLALHEACGASLFAVDGRCWECREVVWQAHKWRENLGQLWDTCPKCGVSNPLGLLPPGPGHSGCSKCHLPCFKGLHKLSSFGMDHAACEKSEFFGIPAVVRFGLVIVLLLAGLIGACYWVFG